MGPFRGFDWAKGNGNSVALEGLTARLGDRVVRNVVVLYGREVANRFLPFVALPYLARVLGPDAYGSVLMSQSLGVWLAILVEYGFSLSATRDIAASEGDTKSEADIIRAVLGARTLLFAIAVIMAIPAWLAVSEFRTTPSLVTWALLYAAGQGFDPFWYYQGKEFPGLAVTIQMSFRALATVGQFLAVRGPEDAVLVPALNALAVCASTLLSHVWMYRSAPFLKPTYHLARLALRKGRPIFIFRGAVALYTSINPVLLGAFVPSSSVAMFAGAEKIARGMLGLVNPMAQAVYPRLAALAVRDMDHARALHRLSFALTLGVGLALGVFVAAGAPRIIVLLFGVEYVNAIPVLRILSGLIPAVAISNALGIQWMLPLRLDREFTAIIASAGLLNLLLAPLLAVKFGPGGMAAAAVVAEAYVALAMGVVLFARRLW
ncbi:oligosaccharide flippase family protein [Geochorda subterranea]|uniref:Oligosaccharide flippase family protein n=1 Tax=Geochorda subterranea TaxID=3109564 RepID=A0ABZ1BML5_9FIRM|nr:oligosaccharide flippase family protein [Limnochorda sp. LNt]WRP13730.1 oligosaccharide flippase family protein [Limnochorda sp. LNt]